MALNIDSILESIDELGPFQRRIYFLLCLPVLFVGAANLSYVFLAATPNYRCFIPGCDNASNPQYEEPFLNFTTPLMKQENSYESCKEYRRFGNVSMDSCDAKYFTHYSESCQHGIIFDKSIYESTLVTEFGLTCSRNWEAAAIQTLFFVGFMLGSFVFGILADIIGRRPTILICIFIMSTSGFGEAFMPNLIAFNTLRFINAFGIAGLFQTAFVLGMEFVGPSKRVMFGVIGQYFFAVGEMLLGLLAWRIRNWRLLQMVLSGPMFGFLLYVWVIPESVRWLQSKGQHIQVLAKLEEIAKENKKPMPIHLLAHEPIDDMEDSGDDTTVFLNPHHRVSMINIFSSYHMSVRLICMVFIWVVTTLVYYGLSYSAVDLTSTDSGPYLSFVLNAFVEIPGYTIAWFGMNRWGRRGTLLLSLICSGIACALSGYISIVPNGPLITFLIGKCSITTAFAIIYVFTAEMFPTTVRNTVLGLCSTFARMGGMLAPFSPIMKNFYPELPMLVFGGLAFAASMASLTMPETLGTSLPDSMSEAMSLGKTRVRVRVPAEADETTGLLSHSN